MGNPYLTHISKLAPSPCTCGDPHEVFLGADHQAEFRVRLTATASEVDGDTVKA